MGTMFHTRAMRSIVLALAVAAGMLVAAAPASAATSAPPAALASATTAQAPAAAPSGPVTAVASNCSYGIREPQRSLFYAWAICRSGSGYYRVGFGCQYFTGETYWVWGPTRSVGQGESRGQCHAYTRPVATSVQTWT